MTEKLSQSELLSYATEIVSAYVSNNSLQATDVPAFVESVFKTLAILDSQPAIAPERPQPAVPIRKSVTDDHIICLEDGKKLKMLKRHLKTSYGMTPEEYRERWGLPMDYPMVTKNYAAQRSSLAKKIGLGKHEKTLKKGRGTKKK